MQQTEKSIEQNSHMGWIIVLPLSFMHNFIWIPYLQLNTLQTSSRCVFNQLYVEFELILNSVNKGLSA